MSRHIFFFFSSLIKMTGNLFAIFLSFVGHSPYRIAQFTFGLWSDKNIEFFQIKITSACKLKHFTKWQLSIRFRFFVLDSAFLELHFFSKIYSKKTRKKNRAKYYESTFERQKMREKWMAKRHTQNIFYVTSVFVNIEFVVDIGINVSKLNSP